MKLGTLLLRNAVIGLTQLEAALRNQVLYGGKLGTNLVELGFVELDLLADYLSELSGLQVATPELLDAAPREALQIVGAELAHDLGVIPLGATEDGSLAVAMIDPDDLEAISALQDKIGAAVAPLVVPELRALYYLEKLYGLPRKARFIRSGARRMHPRADTDERRKTQPAGGVVMPPTATVTPRRRRTNTEPQPPSILGAPSVSYGVACERVDAALHREQIADALVEFGRGRFEATVVFIVRDGNALGWRANLPAGRPAVKVEEISLPLGGVSALQAAHDDRRPYLGAPPSAGRPVESQLWSMLALDPPPKEILVAPITVKQRVVNLVYAHPSGGGAFAPDVVKQLCDLAVRTQSAYVRLIRASK
jgi:hypothetical protein